MSLLTEGERIYYVANHGVVLSTDAVTGATTLLCEIPIEALFNLVARALRQLSVFGVVCGHWGTSGQARSAGKSEWTLSTPKDRRATHESPEDALGRRDPRATLQTAGNRAGSNRQRPVLADLRRTPAAA